MRAHCVGALALLALLAALSAPAPAQEEATAGLEVPGGPGTVSGRVIQRESREPVGGVTVVLYALSSSGVPGMRRTESDAEGRFAFPDVSTDPGTAYLVGARYRGVPHPGGRAVFAPGSDAAQVDVVVSEVTDDPSVVAAPEVTLRLDVAGPDLRVTETVSLQNETPRTFYVAPDARPSARPALRVPLPEDATGFQMPLGVVPEGVEHDGGRVTFWGPVHPGPGELAFTYRLPLEGATPRLRATLPDATERVTLLLPKAGLEPRDLALAEAEEIQVEGRPYRAFRGAPPGPVLDLALALPPSRVDPDAFHPVEARLFLRVDDAAVDVSETHTFRVEGDARVSAPDDGPLAWIPLPERTGELRFATSDPGLSIAPDPRGGLAVRGQAPPGESSVELSYRLAVEGLPAELVKRVGQRTPLLSIFLPDSGHWVASSDRLHRRRPIPTDDLTYMHLEAFEVEPGEEVRLRLEPLPPRAGLGGSAAVALSGVLALVAVGLLVAPLRRARPEPAHRDEEEPSAAARERGFVYDAIRDLDDDYELGKVSAEDHRALRDELRARAVALVRAERSGAARPSGAAHAEETPTEPACGACGAALRDADRFCSQCGAAVEAAGGRGTGR